MTKSQARETRELRIRRGVIAYVFVCGDRRSAIGDVTSQSFLESVWNSTSDGVWLAADTEQERRRENLDWLYEPDSAYRVFIICFLIICGGELFQSPTTAMSDAATLQILGRDELDKYGAQRAWGPLGWASWYEHCLLALLSSDGVFSDMLATTSTCRPSLAT